jgi:predicted nucleic acid-binding protein
MTVDRVFLDANVLFSLAYGSSGLARLWELAKKGKCLLLASHYVIEEARRNLHHPAQLERLENFLADLQIVLEADRRLPCPIELPQKDWPVLMAAIYAKADFLLTGDRQHFGRHFGQTVGGVKICMPRHYLLNTHQAC